MLYFKQNSPLKTMEKFINICYNIVVIIKCIKKSYISFLFLIALLISSCKTNPNSTLNIKSTSKTVSDVLKEKTSDSNHGGNSMNPNDTANKYTANKSVSSQISASSSLKKSSTYDASDIDIDLTKLSSTMIYSEVYNMMSNPEEYLGMTIRMDGDLAIYKYPERNYYTCIIKDAAACCQQGMEFLWKGEHKYPEDYPNEGDGIIVTGIFDIYYEDQVKYCQLKDATLVRKKV